LDEIDITNFKFYSESKESFKKKRVVEGNKMPILHEFTGLKQRVLKGAVSLKDEIVKKHSKIGVTPDLFHQIIEEQML
jgi:hypothetical protein